MNQLPQASDSFPLSEYIPASLREAQRRFLLLTALFMLIALVALSVAYFWPKQYPSSTTILVTEDNIIRQLMDGRAVPTSVYDRAAIAREVMFSRRVMDEILELGGWLDDSPGPAERESRARLIEHRTTVGAPRDNLIQIIYRDETPQRAREITERFARAFMAESAAAKRRESREAYEFIAEQVNQYHGLLIEAETRLKVFREANEDARPGSGDEVHARVAELRKDIEELRIERQGLLSRQRNLEQQVAGIDTETGRQTYQSQLRQRIAMTQDELDALLLDLTPRHPDVVRTRHHIEELRNELLASGSRGGIPIDGADFQPGALHQDISRDLAGVRTGIAGIDSRIIATRRLLEQELARGRRVADSDLQHAELIRDHSVNQTIYEDLLNRLENARLSMRLDEMGRGLTFSIHEPATEAGRPSGPRFLHLAAGGFMAAMAMPLGLLLLFVRLDPRVRSPEGIERVVGLPVLGAVPRYWAVPERRRLRTRIVMALVLVMITLAAYGIAGWLRITVNA